MGAVEEGAKVASGVVDALKSQPLSLVMLIINVALVALLWRVAEGVKETREREVALLYDNQKHIAEILSRCVVTDPNKRTEVPRLSIETVRAAVEGATP